jgi:hypothetical protein
MAQLLLTETKGSAPIQFQDKTLTLFSKVFRLQLPGLPGGIIWNRPVSVLVQTNDGREQVLPISDVTRQVAWSLLAASLVSVLMTGLILLIKRK